jgi:hypothetical protein
MQIKLACNLSRQIIYFTEWSSKLVSKQIIFARPALIPTLSANHQSSVHEVRWSKLNVHYNDLVNDVITPAGCHILIYIAIYTHTYKMGMCASAY